MRCTVSGRVQGVFYRAATREVALRLGLAGWARNLDDGRVEVVACGPAHGVEELKQWLHRGPPHAAVTDVLCETIEDEGWSIFAVC